MTKKFDARWTMYRKAELLAGVDSGQLRQHELDYFCISPEELDYWRKLVSRGGVQALRNYMVQVYRDRPRSKPRYGSTPR